MAAYLKKLKPHFDKRGWFAEVLKRSEINRQVRQISAASLEPGAVRGNHYHLKRTEWFFCFGGAALVCLKNLDTKKKRCFKISEKYPSIITFFPNTAHAVKNLSKKTIYFVEASSDIYNPKNTDKYHYRLI